MYKSKVTTFEFRNNFAVSDAEKRIKRKVMKKMQNHPIPLPPKKEEVEEGRNHARIQM